MATAFTAVAVAAVCFGVLSLWLAHEHADLSEQARRMEAARDEARAALIDAREQVDASRQRADRQSSDDAATIADLRAELAGLSASARCLPDLDDERGPGIGDTPIYEAVRTERAA